MNGQEPEQQPLPEARSSTEPQDQVREFLEPVITTHDGKTVVTIPGGHITITESAEALFKAIASTNRLVRDVGLPLEYCGTQVCRMKNKLKRY